jgi:hypothetical protein
MNVIAEAALAKGEKRFNALKAMIPKSFEGLQIAPAAPHEPADAAWVTLEALAQVAANRGIVQEPEAIEEPLQPEDNLTPQERFMLDRLKQAQQKAKEQQSSEQNSEGNSEKIAEDEFVDKSDENQKVGHSEESENELAFPVELPKEKARELELEAARIEQERKIAALEKAAEESTIAEEKTRILREKERLSAEFERLQTAKGRIPRQKVKLSAEEEAAEESLVLEVIREYLEHGFTQRHSLRHYFTPSTFKALLLGTFEPELQTLGTNAAGEHGQKWCPFARNRAR